jgi:hypothetical protein
LNNSEEILKVKLQYFTILDMKTMLSDFAEKKVDIDEYERKIFFIKKEISNFSMQVEDCN